ncbi:MAG: protease family protein [Frankiales bacterium]|nr:protease family protein [Frankiales bacterium]
MTSDSFAPPTLPAPPAQPPALDAAMAALASVPGRAWWRASWRALLWLVVSIAVPVPLVLGWYAAFGHAGLYGWIGAMNIVGEASILGGTLYFARPLRDATYGWGAALGWTRPTWQDVTTGALWALINLGVRFVVTVLLVAFVPQHVMREGSNTSNLHHFGLVGLTLVCIGAVLVAPVAEETLFRGVLLRAGMRRWGFARAALLSSLLFGAFHAYEAASLAGAGVLVLNTAAFGMIQCLLVRRTGRLTPCAITHGLINALALLLALLN